MTQRDQPGASEERLPLEGKLADRKGSRRGCTVGSCRRLSNDGFHRVDSVHPLSHGVAVTAPPTQGSQRSNDSFPAQGSQRPDDRAAFVPLGKPPLCRGCAPRSE